MATADWVEGLNLEVALKISLLADVRTSDAEFWESNFSLAYMVVVFFNHGDKNET